MAYQPGRQESKAGAVYRIRAGFKASLVRALEEKYGVPQARFARVIGVKPRTYTRLRKGSSVFPSVASDRVYRAGEVFELAASVLGSEEKARSWLCRPQFGLAGQVPIDLLDTEPGVEQVRALLTRIEHGVVA